MKVNFKKYIIITGHFGSGKTEIAVNIANKLKELEKNVCLVDFDIVNPFYRSNELKNVLNANGIDIIAPIYANTNVDVPSISGNINKAFDSMVYDHVVFDVGGDDLGAKIISSYKDKIVKENKYEHLCVINLNRPLTDEYDNALIMLKEIENSANIKIDHLVNNSVIIGESNKKEYLYNKKKCQEIAYSFGIDVKINVIGDDIKDVNENNILRLKRYLKNPWDE